MKIQRMVIRGFRSLGDIDIHFDPVTILIGENDSGKSSLLDILSMFLSTRKPESNDYYQAVTGEQVNTIEVIVEFDGKAETEEAKPFILSDKLIIRKLFTRSDNSIQTQFRGLLPTDDRLNRDFQSMPAEAQRNLIIELQPDIDQTQIKNSEMRIGWLKAYVESTQKTEDWITAPPDISNILPRFERYSAMDYRAPETMISKTIKQVFDQTIYEEIPGPDGTTSRQLIEPLRELKEIASTNIRSKVSQLLANIQKYNRSVINVDYEPLFDFSSSIQTGQFRVDCGQGLHDLSKKGDGTKRRLFIGVLEWDREVSLSNSTSILPTIIRGYDEPDTNLHIEAQRLIYQTIDDLASPNDSRIQAIVCTHSLALIDRASAQQIRLLKLGESGKTVAETLDTGGDNDVEYFLTNLAREMGITNSIMFYERCFILVEGESEENALPLLYKNTYRKSLLEDGIRILNLGGNGAAREFLRLMIRNRQKLIIVFLDRDTQTNRSSRLSPEYLLQLGFSEEFVRDRVIFVGRKEFEDSFPDPIIIQGMNQVCPLSPGGWKVEDIAPMRATGKFSDQLMKAAWEKCKTPIRKSDLGTAIGKSCPIDQIPEEVSRLFSMARGISIR